MAKIGKYNGLTDIDGILVGHYTDFEAVSGITVVVCPKGAVAGVDVRGSAPGTRETDLMAPHNLVEQVQAVVLSGGSVFGLAAADGATRWLAEEGYGFPLDHGFVAPIVPAAVLYDLGRGKEFIPPINSDWGRWACEGAGSYPVKPGCVGAGTGAIGRHQRRIGYRQPGFGIRNHSGGIDGCQLRRFGDQSCQWQTLGNRVRDR